MKQTKRERKKERNKKEAQERKSEAKQTVQTDLGLLTAFIYTNINNINNDVPPQIIRIISSTYIQSTHIMHSTRPPSRQKPLPWSAPSNIIIFVRNLQLLHLHHYEDWPNVTVRTLSPSSHNQRQRVKAVEWALYHLCAIWDPDITQDKLRPFFPPLEPLQSVNLRAALFRVLSDLKKNGDLGKETILRKSMLDDCKGEKFDELLAVFSTAVLRRALTASTDAGQLNPALGLSLANGITPDDYQLMLPLILAHRVSLGATGERRTRVGTTFDKFSQLLDNKKIQLEQRSQESPQPVPEKPADFDTLAEHVKTDWLGSEEWANNLLYGGSRSSSDAFLELPFAKAWAKANESTVEDLKHGAASHDLLLDLESRISRQQNRLSRWHEFRAGEKDRPAYSAPSPSGNPTRSNSVLAFKDHQALTVASIAKAVREPGDRSPPAQEDQSLLLSMDEALARIDGKSSSSTAKTEPRVSPEPTNHTLPSHASGIQEPAAAPKAERENPPIPDTSSDMETESPEVHITETNFEEEPEAEPEPRPKPITLAERTRKSMSLIQPRSTEPPKEQPAPRRHQSRKSFPVNPFETPQKQEPSRTPTPRDELFSDEIDYASVFKSRPRIAQSPVNSPAVHVTPLGDFDLDRDVDVDVDGDGDGFEDYSALGMNSPSVRRTWR